MPANTFEVELTKVGSTLVETVTETANHKDVKELKTRKIRSEYRNAMKDPSRFDQTHMADRDHPTLVMKENEETTFFHAFAFTVGFIPDPEVELEVGAVNCPFEKKVVSGWQRFNVPQAAEDKGGAGNKRFQAGPFRMSRDGQSQKFYKFIVWTDEGLLLDPDIVSE